MVSEIESLYNDIIKWRERFDKLFSSKVTSSRAHRLNELRMYDNLLSRRYKGLTKDEKTLRTLIKQERNNLVRELYPNPLIRLVRNVIAGAVSLVRKGSGMIDQMREEQQQKALNKQLEGAGFGLLVPVVERKLREGLDAFRVAEAISTGDGSMVSLALEFSKDKQQICQLDNIFVKHIKENGQVANFRFDQTDDITSDRLMELVNGRSVKTKSGSWMMVDFNDRDADGNHTAKEIRIPDFSVERLLSSLPLSSNQNRQELVDGLANGKRMDIELMAGGKSLKLQIEALPLKRSLQLYEKGRRVSMDRLHATGIECSNNIEKVQKGYAQKNGRRKNQM